MCHLGYFFVETKEPIFIFNFQKGQITWTVHTFNHLDRLEAITNKFRGCPTTAYALPATGHAAIRETIAKRLIRCLAKWGIESVCSFCRLAVNRIHCKIL